MKLAQLKLEGYQIMGDILEEEYGIDLLKKSEAKQSTDSKNNPHKVCKPTFVDCLAIQDRHIASN
ncbi:hypothetical protein [Dysgonomonas sp. Marseille-P4677]|uniref:hypothetical protein n=1 Tax=Dysgonomonas sp. Marseille-P4677 TaxID=2364790 RepID=UPI001F3A130D|nr:hypothetical protein [Dysgonomonas sp. Marseille-P4677]